MVGENIWKQKWYCVIKNGALYFLESKESDKANKYIVIKDIEELEWHQSKKNVFFFIYKEKLYWLEVP